MKISMLMGTLNRKQLMLQAIDSILRQSYQDFEIIIVDQSDDESTEVSELDPRIKYVHIKEKGLSHARNIGLNYVTGDIVGLMDDDAVYTENTLENVNREFEQDSRLGLVSGTVVNAETQQISLRGMGGERKKITSKNIFKCCISPSMFIRKEFFNSECFDERFGLGNFWGSAEETDVALKILYKGYNALFCPNIVVYHPNCPKKELPLSKLESYSRGFGAICAKHRYQYRNRTMLYLYRRAIFRAFIGLHLSAIKFSASMCRYYKTSIKAKRAGYKSYKQRMCEPLEVAEK